MVEFGNYLEIEEGQEAEAKELLKRDMHDFIDKLCEVEDFWIKKEADKRDPLRQKNTIGWKMAVLYLNDD